MIFFLLSLVILMIMHLGEGTAIRRKMIIAVLCTKPLPPPPSVGPPQRSNYCIVLVN